MVAAESVEIRVSPYIKYSLRFDDSIMFSYHHLHGTLIFYVICVCYAMDVYYNILTFL